MVFSCSFALGVTQFVGTVPVSSRWSRRKVNTSRKLWDVSGSYAKAEVGWNVDHRESGMLHPRLIDSANPETDNGPTACINVNLVVEGLASIDSRGSLHLDAYPGVHRKPREVVNEVNNNGMECLSLEVWRKRLVVVQYSLGPPASRGFPDRNTPG